MTLYLRCLQVGMKKKRKKICHFGGGPCKWKIDEGTDSSSLPVLVPPVAAAPRNILSLAMG